MATLNIINKSPFEKHTLSQCLSRVAPGGAILLIEDAVCAAVPGSAFADQLSNAATEQKLYVLQPDLAARGFADVSLPDSIKQVDYKGFVDLVTEYDLVHSWF